MGLPTLASRRLALTGLAVAGLVAVGAIGATASQATDSFVSGGRSTRAVAVPADHLARAEARARALGLVLGMPGVSHRAARLDDKFEHLTYDEVTSFDARGREVAIARFELDGTVAMAVSLGWQAGAGRALDGPAATDRAAALARAAGLTVRGQPSARVSAGGGGWSIHWPRVVDGVPVRGDGVRISLWPDGSFHGLTRSERPLAAAPARLLTPATVRSIAERFSTERFGSAAADLPIVAVEKAWVAANDTFEPSAPDAPAETLRLAWIVRFDSQGGLTDRLRSVEVWIDAGHGAVIGGDVVE